MVSQVLAVLGMVAVGFLLFTIMTSNPFDRTLPNVPVDGADLNPLLQDLGLIVHPPMLYMGYVGFSVAFAFAIAALINGKLDAAWARWSRPWTTVAWTFLSLGIAWAVGGPTTNLAGADGGSGTRSKTHPYCPGSPERH